MEEICQSVPSLENRGIALGALKDAESRSYTVFNFILKPGKIIIAKQFTLTVF